jgi:hypothetical protein
MHMPSKYIGKTKDGYPIVVRGVNEDNSGVVYEKDGKFVVSCSYPIDVIYDPATEIETLVYEQVFDEEGLAIGAFKLYIGYTRVERDGPGF